jgi:hypothetical protein
MLVNFSHEEIELPRATVLGVAEKTSASLVALINDSESHESGHKNGSTVDSSFRHYVTYKLGHLTPEERSVMEPVLIKYRHVFHYEGNNDFKGTDLVEHKIVTGNAQPIRKVPYWVPFALRKEMQNQIQHMRAKGVIEESVSPWSSPAILVPKKSLDG